MEFSHLMVSNEDPEIVLSLQGYPSEVDAMFYFNASTIPLAQDRTPN
jgi:hypothetical protein